MTINSRESFGANVRRLRDQQDISLRAFAARLGISATYLSKVERAELPPPGEDIVKAIAHALGENEDAMLALAGRVAKELTRIILTNPLPLASFLRAVDGMRAEDIQKYAKAAQRKRADQSNAKKR